MGSATFAIFEGVIFLVLLVTSIFFAKEMIEEYLAGHTLFSLEKKPLSEDYLPTVGVCIKGTRKLLYGEEIWISGFNRQTEFPFAIKEGRNPVPGMDSLSLIGVVLKKVSGFSYPLRRT